MFAKLMDNPIIGFIFGVIVTIITYLISVWSGETLNVWAFAGITSAIVVLCKEVINYFMVNMKFNSTTLFYGITGSLISSALLIFV